MTDMDPRDAARKAGFGPAPESVTVTYERLHPTKQLRQWGPTEVAPDDATEPEIMFHVALWGDLYQRIPPSEVTEGKAN